MRAILLAIAVATLPTSAPARPLTICTPGPYIFFFEWGSAKLDGHSIAVLDNLLENLKNCDDSSLAYDGTVVDVAVDGHSDTSEADAVSWARANAVHLFFREHHVAEKRIKAFGRGAKQLRITTPPDIRELQNRRVEIMLGPP
jgi:OOP family OmpA-OmpF porin